MQLHATPWKNKLSGANPLLFRSVVAAWLVGTRGEDGI
jgi:hypothetical protein